MGGAMVGPRPLTHIVAIAIIELKKNSKKTQNCHTMNGYDL